jgi:hypothetical protein
MTFNYTKAAASAEQLLRNFGKNVTVRKQVAGTYDPATSSAAITNVDTTAKGALLNYTRMQYGQHTEAGTLIQVGDKKLLLSPVNLTSDPTASDLIIAGGFTWNIIDVKTLRPADVTVLYEIQLRRG